MSFVKKCNRCGMYERHIAMEKTGRKTDHCLGCNKDNKDECVKAQQEEGK